MIGRADIEGSKSNVAMNAWLPQASYPCGNFSVTSNQNCSGFKGSIGHTFVVHNRNEILNQADFSPFSLREISVLSESTFGHLRCNLADVPPQPNSPSDNVLFDVSYQPTFIQLFTELHHLKSKQNNATGRGISLSGKPSHVCYTP